MAGGPIVLTEDPGGVVSGVVAAELRAAGHRIVDGEADAAMEIRVEEFRVEAPRAGSGWKVVANLRVVLKVASTPGSAGSTELVYTAERKADSPVRPSLATTERVLGECLGDLGRLVAERPSLARALEAYSRPPGVAGAAPQR